MSGEWVPTREELLYGDETAKLKNQIDALRAENERLREDNARMIHAAGMHETIREEYKKLAHHQELVDKIHSELSYSTEAGGWDHWDDKTVEFLLNQIEILKRRAYG